MQSDLDVGDVPGGIADEDADALGSRGGELELDVRDVQLVEPLEVPL